MERDELAESLDDLFLNLSTMVESELQGANNHLELLKKMNLRVAEEYQGFGDVALGLRVFVKQLKTKSGSFDEYVRQIDVIESQVTHFESVISTFDEARETCRPEASSASILKKRKEKENKGERLRRGSSTKTKLPRGGRCRHGQRR